MFGLPDSVVFVIWLISLFAAIFMYAKWRVERNKPEYTYPDGEEAAFHRLYRRYKVERHMAYDMYRDENMHEHGPFTFPSFAEWVEDRDEKDN
ncbi:hypothetical protein KDI99_gp41 [Arthrobacter phage Greenhouse]|uniref:Uncharacterized protein n=1 Tax=Arthrobacter phage Greenhouse TaxID=1897428 RepID=A0A1I9SE63_9CAUD|nr:hypothetical protein KDI99_gp41 [Arthrobacter phage Greenhouse]AOZ65140.1 hypothetical protein SEA_GREENHOUSE_41 [Arthrobacter phage Greenhouse]